MADDQELHADTDGDECSYCSLCGDPVTGADLFCAGCGAPTGEGDQRP